MAASPVRETAAFGYPRERMLEQRVFDKTFGYPLQAPLLTAGDGLGILSVVDIVRSLHHPARHQNRSCSSIVPPRRRDRLIS
jgi:hypothetical protein